MSLQYLKQEVRDEVDFLQVDENKCLHKFPTSCFQHSGHQSFLQDDTIIIAGHDQEFSKCSK